MDNLTHTLIGMAVAKAGLRQRVGRGTTLILAIASNLPDIDVICLFFGGEYGFLYRRMLTHSVLGVLALSLLAASIFRIFYKHISYRTSFLLCLLGMGLHVFYDLMNSYGVVIFYPFSLERFELAWVFIIDLALWAMLILPFVLTFFTKWKAKETEIFKIAVLALAFYTSFCGWARLRSFQILEKTVRENNIQPDFLYVFPEGLGPHRFRGVSREGDHYDMYLIHVFQGKAEVVRHFQTLENDPHLQVLRQRPDIQQLEWFAKAPVWEILEKDGRFQARVFDLRFVSLALKGRKTPFGFTFDLGAKNESLPPASAK